MASLTAAATATATATPLSPMISLHIPYKTSCALPKQQHLINRSLSHSHKIPAFLRIQPQRFSIRSSSAALSPELRSTLDKVVRSHKVVVFMKGSKDFPQCGFSRTVVQILQTLNVPFETMDIMGNEMLRQGLKEYSSWPTFPQLYIDGEFFGGCDITLDAYQSGELQELLEKTMCS